MINPSVNEIIDLLVKEFGSPCDYHFDGEDTSETMEWLGDWCDINCPYVDDRTCWKAYFKARRVKERYSDKSNILRYLGRLL